MVFCMFFSNHLWFGPNRSSILTEWIVSMSTIITVEFMSMMAVTEGKSWSEWCYWHIVLILSLWRVIISQVVPPPCSKLDNSRSVTSGGTGPHVHVEFCQYAGHMSSYVDYRSCPAVAFPEGLADICQRFSVSVILSWGKKTRFYCLN